MATLPILLGVGGLVLLVGGAELLVRGASRLAIAAGLTPLTVGLTVVAFGTSAPEIAVTVGSALAGRPDVGVGNVLGATLFNLLAILGAAVLVAPLVPGRRLLRLEVPLLLGAPLLVGMLAFDGRLGRLDGVLLLAVYVGGTSLAVRASRLELRSVRAEYARELPAARGSPWPELARVAAGLAFLVLGAGWLVDGASAVARALGATELVIGLTVVSWGTSSPELATTILASLRGERDLAVGNVIGSSLVNLLAVLGLGAAAAPAGLPVARSALGFDLAVVAAAAVAYLVLVWTGKPLGRLVGALFVAYYVAYTVYLVLDAAEHRLLPRFDDALRYFVVPLTALALVAAVIRELRSRRQRGPSRAP